jgi:hypothetical protein
MKFADALMSNKLLKAETLAEATRPQFTTGGLRLRIPDRTAGRGADLRPRRRRSGNERDSSRVSGVGPVGDRVVQPGQSFGFAHGRLAPRPHATQVVHTSSM